MSVVSFKTAMPSVEVPNMGSSSAPASGGSSTGKYILYGVLFLAVGYGVYKFVIEPRMKSNTDNEED